MSQGQRWKEAISSQMKVKGFGYEMPERNFEDFSNYTKIKRDIDQEELIQNSFGGNNSFNKLEQIQEMSPENLREILRQLPNPKQFRKDLVKLLSTANNLLIAYDTAMGPPDEISAFRSSAMNTGAGHSPQDFVYSEDLVLPSNGNLGDNQNCKESNMKHVTNSENELFMRKNLEDHLPHLTSFSLNKQSNVSLRAQDFASYNSQLLGNSGLVGSPQNLQGTFGQQQFFGNNSYGNYFTSRSIENPVKETHNLHRESRNIILEDLSQKIATLKKNINIPEVLFQEMQLYQETYLTSNQGQIRPKYNNEGHSGSMISLQGGRNIINGATNNTIEQQIEADKFEDDEEYQDQLNINACKRYYNCENYDKNRLKRGISSSSTKSAG